MRSTHVSLFAALAAAIFMSTASTVAAPARQLSQQDQKFLDRAWNINTAEVRLGDLARQRATTADVKAFGKRMVTDHTKLDQELTALATKHGAALPKSIDRHHQELIDKLSKLSGSDFDKQYMTAMIEGHEKAVSAFEKESKDAAQTDVDKWSAQALPILNEHLQLAEKTGKEVGASMPTQGTAIPAAHQEHPKAK